MLREKAPDRTQGSVWALTPSICTATVVGISAPRLKESAAWRFTEGHAAGSGRLWVSSCGFDRGAVTPSTGPAQLWGSVAAHWGPSRQLAFPPRRRFPAQGGDGFSALLSHPPASQRAGQGRGPPLWSALQGQDGARLPLCLPSQRCQESLAGAAAGLSPAPQTLPSLKVGPWI